jgi:formamidopyrimidine-DNA glycosylase
MPELPEAEYMVRRLLENPGPGPVIAQARVLRPSLVAPQSPAAIVRHLKGRRIEGYTRRAKNVLIHCEGGWTARIQLGMSGHVYIWSNCAGLPRFTRVALYLDDGRAIVFEDARTFGNFHVHRTADLPEVLAAYGPEPLDDAWSWSMLRDSAARAKGPIKPFLLDQSRVVGLGNIWAAEALWEARISPFRAIPSLTNPEWRRLHAAIRKVLTQAIDGTFKVTAKPEEFPDADLLTCRVYGREGEACRRCRSLPVRRQTQAGRSTFYCAKCQR